MTRPAVALFLGASSMFATMYSTQAILPELESGLGCSAAAAGLSITVVVFAVAIFGWFYGPLSDRAGRVRVMIGSAAAIVVPTALLAIAPGLPAFLALRAAQGALMPGLLVVAVPYVAERFRGPGQGAAMGAYTGSLVFGGLVGRVGTAVVAGQIGWRGALAVLTVLPATGALAMWAWLPRDRPHAAVWPSRVEILDHLQNRRLLANAACAGTSFFAFVGVFTYATHRLTEPPFGLSLTESGLVYSVWLVGALLPALGGIADRVGPARLLPAFVACGAAGGLLTLADLLPVVMLGMAMMALGMFSTVTACQLLIPRIASHNRGTATSLHLTVYYLLGGLGAYLPGLALSAGWGDVVAVCMAASAVALLLAGLLAARLPAQRPALG